MTMNGYVSKGDEIDEDLLNGLLTQYVATRPSSGTKAYQTYVTTASGASELHYRNSANTGWIRIQWGEDALDDDAVTTSKIKDGAVTLDKIPTATRTSLTNSILTTLRAEIDETALLNALIYG